VDKYAVELKPSARKEVESLPDTVLARVLHRIESLADHPRPAGCKKLRGYKDLRVVYIVDDAAQRVSVTRIAHRREVYD